MAQESIIPKRPANDSDFGSIKANDRDCLSYSVAFSVPNERAFALFHPEFLDEQGKLTKVGKIQCRQFFSYARNKEYQDSYSAYLKEFLGKKQSSTSETGIGDIDDSRKDKALKSLLNQAMSLVEGGSDLDAESLKTISEIFKKIGLLKDEVEQEMRPIRVLPTRCGECRYRIGVESMVLNGQILDLCQWCKARKCAEEHGYRFNDGKDLLEIPKEVIAELESKNNIRLEDILSGKMYGL